MDRALVMVGMPGGGLGPNPQRDAAVKAWDAWQRNQFAEDNPSYLPASAFEIARTEFVALCPPPVALFTPPSPDVANWLKRAAGTWGTKRQLCILKAKEAQEAQEAQELQKSLPTPAVHDHSLSQADKQSWEGLRAPVQGVSISYAVIHFAGKGGISLEEAEAVLAHLKPADGHRTNALLAQQVFARFAKNKGIPVKGAMATMREWAEGRE